MTPVKTTTLRRRGRPKLAINIDGKQRIARKQTSRGRPRKSHLVEGKKQPTGANVKKLSTVCEENTNEEFSSIETFRKASHASDIVQNEPTMLEQKTATLVSPLLNSTLCDNGLSRHINEFPSPIDLSPISGPPGTPITKLTKKPLKAPSLKNKFQPKTVKLRTSVGRPNASSNLFSQPKVIIEDIFYGIKDKVLSLMQNSCTDAAKEMHPVATVEPDAEVCQSNGDSSPAVTKHAGTQGIKRRSPSRSSQRIHKGRLKEKQSLSKQDSVAAMRKSDVRHCRSMQNPDFVTPKSSRPNSEESQKHETSSGKVVSSECREHTGSVRISLGAQKDMPKPKSYPKSRQTIRKPKGRRYSRVTFRGDEHSNDIFFDLLLNWSGTSSNAELVPAVLDSNKSSHEMPSMGNTDMRESCSDPLSARHKPVRAKRRSRKQQLWLSPKKFVASRRQACTAEPTLRKPRTMKNLGRKAFSTSTPKPFLTTSLGDVGLTMPEGMIKQATLIAASPNSQACNSILSLSPVRHTSSIPLEPSPCHKTTSDVSSSIRVALLPKNLGGRIMKTAKDMPATMYPPCCLTTRRKFPLKPYTLPTRRVHVLPSLPHFQVEDTLLKNVQTGSGQPSGERAL